MIDGLDMNSAVTGGLGFLGIAAAVWAIWAKLHKTTTGDAGVTDAYDQLREHNAALAASLKGQSDLIDDLKARLHNTDEQVRTLKQQLAEERIECRGEIEELRQRVTCLQGIIELQDKERELRKVGQLRTRRTDRSRRASDAKPV